MAKMNTKSLAAVLTLLFLSAGSAFAEDSAEIRYQKESAQKVPDYYTINAASIRNTLLDVRDADETETMKMQEPVRDLNGILVSVDDIMNVGRKIWKIVQDNKPVLNINTLYATAYPSGITSAKQLGGWSKPKVYTYGFYAANMFGGTMIDCTYKVTFTYNGNYNGTGKYLTAVGVIPTVTTVAWGYTFEMKASVPDSTIANVGTYANPVAAMQLKLSWKMHTVLKEVDGASVYYVQGDGYYEEIASPWKAAKEVKMENLNSVSPLLMDPAKVF